MDIYYDGLIVGAFAFVCIGVFHPIVIKTEFESLDNVLPLVFVHYANDFIMPD